MGSLFNSESTNQTTNASYADSFNKNTSLTFAPSNSGGNVSINVNDPRTGNAAIDGLVKIVPFAAAAILVWAFLKK